MFGLLSKVMLRSKLCQLVDILLLSSFRNLSSCELFPKHKSHCILKVNLNEQMNEEICVCGKNAFSVKQYDDGKHQANCSKH